MAAPTIYSWLDTNAPQMTRGGGLSDIQDVFQKCFIDGYGSKVPPAGSGAGWTIPFSDASSFILQQGGTQVRKCGIKLYDYATYYCKIHAAVSWSDLNTPVTEWTTGDSDHRVGVGYGSNTAYNIPWFIMATRRAVYVQFGYNALSTNTTLFSSLITGNTLSNYHWFFGDYKPTSVTNTFNQLLTIINQNTGISSSFLGFLPNANGTSVSGLLKLASGSASGINYSMMRVDFLVNKSISASASSAGGAAASAVKDFIPTFNGNNLITYPARISGHREILGEMPGLSFPLNPQPYRNGSALLSFQLLGNTIYVFNTGSASNYFITDDDWGID